MARFHVNPTTLEPGRCRAKKSCPFGDASEHFDTPQEAQVFAEKRLAESMDAFAQKGDFALNEVVKLGEYYDTPGREATVIAVEKENVQLKSYDDGETYWVPKEFITDPDSEMFVGRKDSRGDFVTKEQAFELRARQRLVELESGLKTVSDDEKKTIDDVWSNSSTAEATRRDVMSLLSDHRSQLVTDAFKRTSTFANDNPSDWAVAEAVKDTMLAELMKDKISDEQYFDLAEPVLRGAPSLSKILG